MELLERYIHAVRKYLPWDRQDDIAAELRTNLQAQLEDKESELGRPLTDAEAESWIRQLGAPRRVADRYRPARFLIGPELYSNYLLVLRIVLGWTLALNLFVGVLRLSDGRPHVFSPFIEFMRQLAGGLFESAAMVTLIFAIIEFVRTRQGRVATAKREADWSPCDLPPLEIAGAETQPRKLGRVIAGLAFGCLGLVWLLVLPHYPYLIIGPGAWYLSSSPYVATPTLQLVYWLIVGLLALSIVWRISTLVTGRWQAKFQIEILVFRLLGLVPLVVAFTAPGHQFFQLAESSGEPAKYAALLPTLNAGFSKLVVILFAIHLIQLIWQLVRMAVAGYRRRLAASPSSVQPRSAH